VAWADAYLYQVAQDKTDRTDNGRPKTVHALRLKSRRELETIDK